MLSPYVMINKFYDDLVNPLTYTAPVVISNSIERYRSEELEQLKENSLDAHTVRADIGNPRNGIFNMLS